MKPGTVAKGIRQALWPGQPHWGLSAAWVLHPRSRGSQAGLCCMGTVLLAAAPSKGVTHQG